MVSEKGRTWMRLPYLTSVHCGRRDSDAASQAQGQAGSEAEGRRHNVEKVQRHLACARCRGRTWCTETTSPRRTRRFLRTTLFRRIFPSSQFSSTRTMQTVSLRFLPLSRTVSPRKSWSS